MIDKVKIEREEHANMICTKNIMNELDMSNSGIPNLYSHVEFSPLFGRTWYDFLCKLILYLASRLIPFDIKWDQFHGVELKNDLCS